MLDPADLNIVTETHRPSPSFVGIRKGEEGLELCLPIGFDEFPAQLRQERRDFFFRLYRTLSIFQEDLSSRVRHYEQTQDTGYTSSNGARFVTQDDEEVILYAKIPALEAVLESYDILRIFRVIGRPRRTEKVDYAQIHRYLDKAVYLEGNVAHVDEMTLTQPTLTYSESDIVRMYCFIFYEVKQALGENEGLRAEIKAQAFMFKYKYMYSDSSLFTDAHDRTIQVLKRLLSKIHSEANYKDADYWHFYDAVETFLFGKLDTKEGGAIWGISSFALVWEDMCMTYVFEHKDKDNIVFADPDRKVYCNNAAGGQPIFIGGGFENPFHIERGSVRRYMRPDLVRKIASKDDEEVLSDFFEIEKNNSGCNVRLKKRDEFGKEIFKQFVEKIRLPGSRRQKVRTVFKTKHVIPGRMENAKREITSIIRKYSSLYRDQRDKYLVFDFKYMSYQAYMKRNLGSKATKDIKKQLVYEYCLQLIHPNCVTESTLDVPHYFRVRPEGIGELVKRGDLNRELRLADIDVFKVDYVQVQDVYHETRRPSS
jgi:hypothetical protein